ncbi:hypothetical protein OG462_41430 [Streptomyces sp. NBC_01077]|uniref:hypothetical protein n=1 Tax=Streptomyces sp. NBC_01077 TaxID=2903746 RepID=UPI00386B45F7|nr:hypothetical protein OG462_41430 [Streptomyces sp. NBC_01077]
MLGRSHDEAPGADLSEVDGQAAVGSGCHTGEVPGGSDPATAGRRVSTPPTAVAARDAVDLANERLSRLCPEQENYPSSTGGPVSLTV